MTDTATPVPASAASSAPAGAQWFALHTLSGQEGKVKTYIEKFKKPEELDDYIFEILLPTEVVSEIKSGKKSTKVRKLYPGYLFIQMRLYGEDQKLINKPWYFVKETTGVIGFVGGDNPSALQQSDIDEIRFRIEAAAGKEVPKVAFSVGENVKITDGAFASLAGRIDEIDPERGKLKVSVSIFGRFTPVELEYWQVQRTTE
jgi:transcriptional antiterminator NusG